MHVFDTEDAPSTYDNFEWNSEWCDSFASSRIERGSLVTFSLPATSHDDFDWVRVEFVDTDGTKHNGWTTFKARDQAMIDISPMDSSISQNVSNIELE